MSSINPSIPSLRSRLALQYFWLYGLASYLAIFILLTWGLNRYTPQMTTWVGYLNDFFPAILTPLSPLWLPALLALALLLIPISIIKAISRKSLAAAKTYLTNRENARLILKKQKRLLAKLGTTPRNIAAGLIQTLQQAYDDKQPLDAPLQSLEQLYNKNNVTLNLHGLADILSLCGAVIVVLAIRAFVIESFEIPSGSMLPNLQIGDKVFVNKMTFGIRLPFTDIKILPGWRYPHHGEVVVFAFPGESCYPEDKGKDFVKRVIGLPGDTIDYKDGQLSVNGSLVPRKKLDTCDYQDKQGDAWQSIHNCTAYQETHGKYTYTTVYEPIPPQPQERACSLTFPFKVPPGQVFVMGDNRDHSLDGRFWGFVPYHMLKGRASFIWWSQGLYTRFERIFKSIH